MTPIKKVTNGLKSMELRLTVRLQYSTFTTLLKFHKKATPFY